MLKEFYCNTTAVCKDASTLKIFGVIEYRFDRRDDYVERLTKIINFARTYTRNGPKILFHLQDSGIGSISAVERIIKKFPIMKAYEYLEKRRVDESGNDRKILSNITGDIWYEKNNSITGAEPLLDPEIFIEIGKGIPRSFPLFSTTYIFDQIDWRLSNDVPTSPMARKDGASSYAPAMTYFSPSITLTNGWGMSHREIHLSATVDYPYNEISPSSPIFKTESLTLALESLGKIRNEEIVSLPSENEQLLLDKNDPLAKQLIDQYKQNEDDLLRSFSLPHEFDAEEFRISDPETKLEFRKTMTDVMRNLGFNYQSKLSGYGVLIMTKHTPKNNQVTLSIDVGRFNDSLACQLEIQGPLWKHRMDVKFFPKIHYSYRLKNQEQLQRAMENLSVIIERIWLRIILPIDQIYGETPQWYRYHGF